MAAPRPDRPHVGSRTLARADADPPDSRRWLILALLSAAQFMLIVDVTVVNIALPSIGRTLQLDRAQLAWIVTAYTTLFGGLLVFGGRLADTFGRRRMFLIGLAVFTTSSLASGLAPTGAILVLARAAQGIGAAILSPSALSLVTTTFDGRDRNRALAVWAALGGLGAAVGVILGGVLTTGPGWQWIFLVNVPIGIAVGTGAAVLVPAAPSRPARQDLDLVGAISFAIAAATTMWAIIDAGSAGWTSPTVLGRIVAAGLFLAVFVRRERSAAAPLVRLAMLRDRPFAAAVTLMLAGSIILGGMVFVSTLYLQLRVGLSAIQTGVLFLPMALALIAGSQWAAFYIAHHGQRGSASTGFVAAAAGMLYLSRLSGGGDPLVDVVPGLTLGAFGIGAILVSATTTAFSRIDADEAGRASGFVNTSHEMGLALGVALTSTIGANGLISGAGLGSVGQAFLVCAAIGLAGFVVARWAMPTIPRGSGRPVFAH